MKLIRACSQPFESQAPLALIRFAHIGLGLIILWRAVTIGLPGIWYWDDPQRVWLLLACVIYGVLALALILSRLGCWALVGLCLVHLPFTIAWKTMNLGPQIMQALIIALLVSGPALERQRPSWWLPDFNASRRLHLARWSLFLCIAVNHFSAAMFHGDDQFWSTGQTAHALMTNMYLCKAASLVQGLLLSWPTVGPSVIHIFSAIGLILQIIWQMGMIPMMWSNYRWAVFFAKWYGWFFVVFSFGLNISALPPAEVVAWAFLFGPPCFPKWRGWSGALPTHRGIRSRVGELCLSGWRWAAVFYAFLHVLPASRASVSTPGFWDVTRYIGLWAPNVFNEDDLRMGDVWLVFEAKLPSGKVRQLPFNDSKGRRAWWHMSDLIYYGNSLGQRRGVLHTDPFEYLGNPQTGGAAVMRVLQFDRRLHAGEGDVTYTVKLHRSKASRLDLPSAERFKVNRKPFLEITLKDQRVANAVAGSEKVQPLRAALVGKDLADVFRP